MLELLVPYLLAVAAFVVVVLVGLFAHRASENARKTFEAKSARIPDFIQYANLRAELDELELKVANGRAAVSQAEALIQEADEKRQWLRDNEKAIVDAEKAQIELKDLQDKLDDIRQDIDKQKEELDEKKQECRDAEWTARGFREQADKAEKERDEAIQKRDAASAELAKLQLEIETKTQELGTLRSDITTREIERDRLQATKENLEKEIEALEAKHEAEVQRREQELEKLQQAHEAEVQRRVQELEKLQEAREAEIQRQQDELKQHKQDVEDLETKKDELRQQIEDKQDELRQLIEDKKDELRQLIEDKQRELDSLEARAAAAKATVAANGGGVGAVDDPLDEVKVAAVEAATFSGAADADEDDLLASFKQELSEEGLVFHPRVIDAFHTALKVQNESPLLVLAGISGTGKSLLPQRYADAFGMHSLMVPVQPRWDSPQDLLGFFNYLEGRYKPTELTRALVQFDDYGEIPLPEESELPDRMLLVLLDEMNLARVEYYFSEFLSRLEKRRNLSDMDEAGRLEASLAIEVGSAGGDMTQHHVFTGRNVLFVGTINEDESTQTLSDKVVDRANVMRFGRPGRLDRAASDAQEQRRKEHQRAENYLESETWTSWIDDAAPLHSEHHKLAIKQIAALNEALKEVGRPFAYRTRDAILAYARQYPGRSDARIKLALADQVEQRVLPKLRGIDPTDPAGNSALRQVLEVVDQLGDPELSEAIERGKSGGHGHSFLWHGVDRAQES